MLVINFWGDLHPDVKSVIISSVTTIVVFLLGWFFKILHDKFSLNYKLKKEFSFSQKIKLKNEISKNKIPLLNAAEDLNYRFWNFNNQLSNNYHVVSKDDWFESNQYYLNSFIYRFLVFIHYVLKTESDTLTIDSTIAEKEDILFLKYIKTFKSIYCDVLILNELGYKGDVDSNHFFKNDLHGFTKWVTFNKQVKDFEDFKNSLKHNYSELSKVIEYFTSITNSDNDMKLNVLRSSHLIIIGFLNSFGHSYQITEKEKINIISKLYKEKLKIKKGLKGFIYKNKLENDLKWVLNKVC